MQNFALFHAIESKIELSQEFWEKLNKRALHRDICTQIASLLFLMTYILYINFCAVLSIGN